MESLLAVEAEGTFDWDRIRHSTTYKLWLGRVSEGTSTVGHQDLSLFPPPCSILSLRSPFGLFWGPLEWWWIFEAPVYDDPGFVQAG